MPANRGWTSTEIHLIVNQTNELGADLVVLLGDYVAGLRFVTGTVDGALRAEGAPG